MSILGVAVKYTRRGWKVLPLALGSKNPNRKGWQSLYLTEAVLPLHFHQEPQNIGVLLGEPSNWLVDVDLDHPRAVELADQCLPTTPAVFGRIGKPRSHRLYRVTGQIASKKYRSKVHGMIVELRATGMQTVFPPSVHPSGETIEWADPEALPAEIDPSSLFKAVENLATAVRTEFGEKKTSSTDEDEAPATAGAITKRLQNCLDAMQRMTIADGEADGSNRLFAAACRTVEWDLDEQQAIACIRTYAKRSPFPRGWTDAEIVDRIHDAEERVDRGTATGEKTGRGPSQATSLVGLCEALELFHDDDTAYVTLRIEGRVETMRLRSMPFRSWLSRWYFDQEGAVPGGQALADAIVALEGKARFDGPQIKVHVRLAEHDGAIYLDLGDAERNIVEITRTGWRMVKDAPVRLRRPRGMQALPAPTTGGSLLTLREFINLEDDTAFILLVAWLVAAFRPGWPLPILIFSSEQGSGKSTTSRLLRLLIDPNAAPIRCQPKEPRDLMIAASHSVVVALDNLSSVPVWLSDALCRLSTGGGFSTRVLYENDDEMIFDSLRPVILNGIDDVASRSDLLDRAIRLSLPSIPEERRQPERLIYARFEAARPKLLGALLSAVTMALARVGAVKLDRSPRMADFAEWIVAAEPALPWPNGAFMAAYCENRAAAHELALESTPVAEAIFRFVAVHEEWTGKPSELHRALTEAVGEAVSKQPDWPKRANNLTSVLKLIAPNLREIGVHVQFPKRSGRRRQLVVSRVPRNAVTSVTPRHNGSFGAVGEVGGDAGARSSDAAVTQRFEQNRLDVTLGDAGDAESPDCSARGWDDDIEERMAMMEFEGGLCREQAEALALRHHRNGQPQRSAS